MMIKKLFATSLILLGLSLSWNISSVRIPYAPVPGFIDLGGQSAEAMAVFPYSFWKSWPTGKDGPLVLNNQNLSLSAGDLRDYSSISLLNHSIFYIYGPSPAWTRIGCSGNFTIDATSAIYSIENGLLTGTTTGSTPDGRALSYFVDGTQGYSGGYGGQGGTEIGGAGGSGNGGGGGGNAPGDDGSATQGGNGGGSFPNGFIASGGVGFSQAGEDGLNDTIDGGGGGGGFRGYHGGGISITVKGTVSLTAGAKIYANGSAGEVGGVGGNGSLQNGAGGGGGGNGGSGGKIDFRWKGAGTNPTAFCVVTAGAGGTGGGAGTGSVNDGNAGDSGFPGAAGTCTVSTF